jgi:putative addiction module component (TIGR02574 family)
MSVPLNEIRRMSVPERLKLLDQIWETLLDEPEPLPLSAAQGRELDRRLEGYRRSGDRGISWEEMERRFEAE